MRIVVGVVAAIVALLAGAFWYFSTPDVPRSVLEAKYASPSSQFLMLPDGARARVQDVGPRDAETIVLIHGSNASLETWAPWVQLLSDKFRVVTFDLPGHGLTGAVPNGDYSQAGMVVFTKEVVDKLGLSLFVIGGNSMGGGVAARFAETYPTLVSHLILVDAAGMPVGQGGSEPLAFRLARTPILDQIVMHITPRSLVREGLNHAIVRKQVITDAMIDRYWDFARMAGTRQATAARFQLPKDDYVAGHIRDIRAQTLILWGDDDRLIPVAAASAYNAAIPGSRLIVYHQVGHIPMEEVADQSAKDVRDFLIAPITPPQPD